MSWDSWRRGRESFSRLSCRVPLNMEGQKLDEITEIIQTLKSKSFQEAEDKLMMGPIYHIRDKTPVEPIPIQLCHVFNHWFEVPADKFKTICEIIQWLHSGTLLLDDIQDNATHREGVPVAHSIYGVGLTLNTASFALQLALEKVHSLNHSEAIKVYIEQILELHRGQGIEIIWKDQFQIPTEFDYKMMAVRKTGALFLLALRLLQLFTANKKYFSRLLVLLALYFQIWNDQRDVRSAGDDFCKDLAEGYFNFPIIHAIQNEDTRKDVLKLLRQRPSDAHRKKQFLSLLEKSGSLKYTEDTLKRLQKDIREEIVPIGPNPLLEVLLQKIFTS